MGVWVGSARSSYGNTTPGDQNGGREVSREKYYVHSKGWYVIRAKDPAAREKIAVAMEHACDNNDIGYSQPTRLMLYNDVKAFGFDPAKTTKPVNTDCSALVRVCVHYAGITVENFITSSEVTALMAAKAPEPERLRAGSGSSTLGTEGSASAGRASEGEGATATSAFELLKDDKHCKSSDFLKRGDVLVTRSKGHTVVVLNDGAKADQEPENIAYKLGERILKNGMDGEDVKELQTMLIGLDYDCGAWGADGEFGDATELAVERFQTASGCAVDGEVGPETLDALKKALEDAEAPMQDARYVRIVNGNCYVRSAPNTSGSKLGVAHRGDVLKYQGQTSADGWNLVEYDGKNGWVSGRYSEMYVPAGVPVGGAAHE